MQHRNHMRKAVRLTLLTFHFSLFTSALALMTSCLEETFPTSSVTSGQLEKSESSLEQQNVGIAASVMKYGSSYSHIGYPALMLWRDVHCAELPIYATTYDYLANSTSYMGEGQLFYDWWYQYYNTIHNANLLIGMVNPSTAQQTTLTYLGNALGYRAWCYLEASQMWEYKRTGVTVLDERADNNGIWGLTIPIVTEKTTKQESHNNPRAPFYTMYRFLHTDLTNARQYLKGYTHSQSNQMDEAAICALSARFWMLLGSRFEQSADDLKEQLRHEADNDGYLPLGITTAAECYALAADFAQQAINQSGTPTTQSQWMDPKQGFNTAIQSWILGIEMKTDDNTAESWKNYTSFLSPEADFGVANSTYEAYRLCDAMLYGKICDSDWRKLTWVAPSDAGNEEAASKYATTLSSSEFAALPALCGLKYHPAGGERTEYKSGSAVDIPIIRVEEMYYLLAEAKAHTDGLAAGIEVLNSFTNTWRYTDGSYACTATTMEELQRELILQKRIEFWGEGIVYWDYKRLNLGVTRKYEGSNHPSSYQHNSPDGYCARWWNFYIPSNEYGYNDAVQQYLNPDPSLTSEMEY